VTNVSKHGFWLFIGGREKFLAFEDFPWFREAPIDALLNVQLPHPGHFYWPDLDVDLSVESVDSPERFPLVSKGGSRRSATEPPSHSRSGRSSLRRGVARRR